MVFVRDGFTAKKMQNLEIKNAKPIYLELTIVKKKWYILFNSPKHWDRKIFDENSVNLNKTLGKYDNIILEGDLNLNEVKSCSDCSKIICLIWKIYLACQALLNNQLF